MNKKLLLSMVTILTLVLGIVYYLNQGGPDTAGKNIAREQTKSDKFFSPDDIKEGDVVIEINKDGEFSPSEVDILAGDRVVWINNNDKYAWPASDLHPSHNIYPEFDPLEPMAPGEAWGFVFEKEGSWNFHDHLRPFAGGVVRVSK